WCTRPGGGAGRRASRASADRARGLAGRGSSHPHRLHHPWCDRATSKGLVRGHAWACGAVGRPLPIIPGRATDLGFTRDRRLTMRKSATADLRGSRVYPRSAFDDAQVGYSRLAWISRLPESAFIDAQVGYSGPAWANPESRFWL